MATTLRRVGHERSVILFDRLELFRPADAAIELFRSLLALTGSSQVVATTSLRDVASSGVAEVLIDLEKAGAPIRAPEVKQPAEREPLAPTSAPEPAVASPVHTLPEPAAPIAVERALSTYRLRTEEEVPPAPDLVPLNSADETAMVDPLAAAKGQSLPFAPDSPLARLARLREEAARERAEPGAPRPAQQVERGTVALPDGIPTGAAIPFEEINPEAVDLTMFPLERYAEITVALAKSDDRTAVIRRFVLTEGMWRAITQAWATRIDRDPTLRAEFHAVVERLRRKG